MKLLALSDIHDNLVAVRHMRACEDNDFDAIVVAGDIGNNAAPAFFGIMATFECPVVYVFGNWDHTLDYAVSYGPAMHLLHLNVITIGDLHFTGFSGCPTNWGRNPIAEQINDTGETAKTRILQANRKGLRDVIEASGIDPRRIVIVTHERLTRVADIAPGPLLHLYGHIHQFSERRDKETTLVNVSVLDRPVTARPKTKPDWGPDDCRNFNAGNYAIIEVGRGGDVRVRRVDLPCRYPDWVPLDGERRNGIAWIDEEMKWSRPDDPRLARYRQSAAR